MSQGIQNVTDATFETAVLKSAVPVVVDFWAPWCGPCRALAPSLEAIAGQIAGKAVIAKVNIDESPNAPTQYGVRSIPTLMIFKDGRLVSTKVGALPQGELQRWIESSV